MHILNFGKHRGTAIHEVVELHPQYCQSIMNKWAANKCLVQDKDASLADKLDARRYIMLVDSFVQELRKEYRHVPKLTGLIDLYEEFDLF